MADTALSPLRPRQGTLPRARDTKSGLLYSLTRQPFSTLNALVSSAFSG